MSLSLAYSPLLLVVALLAAAVAAYWSYRGTVPALSQARRGVLTALRFAALALLLVLLFEPVLRRTQQVAEPPVLAVLLDDSQSMALHAAGGDAAADTSAHAAREALRRALGDRLPGQVRYYRFGAGVAALDGDDPLDSLSFAAPRTDIAGALERVRSDLQEAALAGVVLVSDGRYNAGRNPLYVADRYPVPLYPVVVGDTTARRDVLIRDVTTNELAYLGAELPVRVRLRAEGYGGERVRVTLTRDGTVLDARTLDLPADDAAEATVELAFTPEQEGLRQLRVQVTTLPGEVTARNNTAAVSVRVLENRRRLLLLAAAPGPDVAALRRLLADDPDTELTTRVQRDRGSFYEGALPDDLAAFDAVVLAGYPGPDASLAVLRRVAAAADDGTPLLFVRTARTDLDALGRTLADHLPVAPERTRTGTVEASPVLTPAGERHPVLDVDGLAQERLDVLPPLVVTDSRWTVAPDARVLLTRRVRGVRLDDPLLALRRRAGGRSAALLGAGTWRWANLPDDLSGAAGLWPATLDNLMQWLTTPEDDRRVRVRPVQDVFGSGEPIELTGQVYDESLNPVPDASVEVVVTAPDGTRYPYTMQSEGAGGYRLEAGRLPEGTYAYRATASREGAEIGADAGRFAVGGASVEFADTRADAALMRQLAARGGGRAWTARTAPDALGTALAEAGTFAPTYTERSTETRLWHLYGLLGLVLTLLTAEWLIRKRSGLV